jgi:hypothetical protein
VDYKFICGSTFCEGIPLQGAADLIYYGKKFMIHLVCSAHIDPVWLWDWEEGIEIQVTIFSISRKRGEGILPLI